MATKPGYVGDVVLRAEARMEPGKADAYAIETGLQQSGGTWNCEELLELAQGLGDERISAIVHTMLNPKNRYARVTPAQRFAVGNALLTRYESARAVYAAALGISEDELVAAGKEW